jgi:transcription antitermination factor NusG
MGKVLWDFHGGSLLQIETQENANSAVAAEQAWGQNNAVVYPWFALQVRARHEVGVAAHLDGQGYEWFLPMYKSRRRWSDRMKEIESPLFPGYLFCRFNPHNRLPILKTPSVTQIVGYDHVPIPIDEEEIRAIRTLVASGVPNQPCSFLTVGNRVRIEAGALRGIEGILMELKGKRRLVLSITLLQRSVAVEIDSEAVSLVQSSPDPATKVLSR